MFRGAWHAALKSFQKVMQLSPGNIYAAFQIGTVKLVGIIPNNVSISLKQVVAMKLQ